MEKLKILLIDDDADFLEIMGTVIKDWGYALIIALNGRDAIDMVSEEKPDILILDYVMPGMDGIETLKKIREIDRDVPVIVFTAHPDIKVIKGTEKLWISAFIPKLSTYSDVQLSLKKAIEMIVKNRRKNG